MSANLSLRPMLKANQLRALASATDLWNDDRYRQCSQSSTDGTEDHPDRTACSAALLT